jgi:hypothetical protein
MNMMKLDSYNGLSDEARFLYWTFKIQQFVQYNYVVFKILRYDFPLLHDLPNRIYCLK